MDSTTSFLGPGWSFPSHPDTKPDTKLDTKTEVLKLVIEAEDISQSLHILLRTEPGERVKDPGYGCALRQFLFVKINPSTLTHLPEVVHQAIVRYEPRIAVGSVLLDTSNISDGILQLEISYTIRSDNTRYAISFPLYLREGSLVPPSPAKGQDEV